MGQAGSLLDGIIAPSIGISILVLALLVYLNRKALINKTFFVFAISIDVWVISAFLSELPRTGQSPLLLSKIAFGGAAAATTLLYNFSLIFPKKWFSNKFLEALRIFISFWGISLVVLILGTSHVVKGIKYQPWGFDVIYGDLYLLFSSFILLTVAISISNFLVAYWRAERHEKNRFQYMLIGLFLFVVTSAFVNIVVRQIVGTDEYYRLGNYSVIFFIGFTAYAIVKHRLMDIRLLTLKLVAYSSAVALLIGGVISAVTLLYVKYELITNLYLLTIATSLSSVFGFFLILRYFPKYTDKIFAKGRYNPQELRRALDRINLTYAQQEDLTKNWLKTIIEQMKITRAAFILTGSSQVSPVEEVGFKPSLKKQAIQALVNYKTKKNSSVIFDELEDSPFKNSLRELGIEVLLPVKTKDQTIGLLALGEKKSGDIYNSQDLNLLEEFSPKAAVALERSKVVTKVSLLYKQAEKIISNEAIKEVLDTTIDSAFLATESEGGSIMLLDEKTKTLSIKASRGIPKKYHYQNIKVGEGIAGWVTLMREPMIIDSKNEKFKKFLKRDHIHSSMCVPLEVRDKLIGVLSINRIKNREAFTKDDCDLVTTVATNVAQLIENARLREEEVRRDKEVINVFIKAVEARDPYTSGHSQAVTKYSVVMAKELGLSEDEVKIIETASKLHDIGKIGVPDQILNKPGKLTEEEWREIKKHPEIGEGLIMQYSNLEEILPIVRHHHESYDGSGYPKGIAGEIIPLGARILAVADAFNAMTSKRPYREALPLAVAIKELKRCSGTQFDPQVVDVFIRILEKNKPLKVIEGGRKNSNLKTNQLKVLAGK